MKDYYVPDSAMRMGREFASLTPLHPSGPPGVAGAKSLIAGEDRTS